MADNNQASYIFGFVFLAFAVYITLKGELPVYAGLVLLSPTNGTNAAGNTTGNTAQQQTSNAIVQGAFAVLGM